MLQNYAFDRVMSLNPGDSVSHYEIIERLGGGGFGVTYKAKDINLFSPNNVVALKQISLTQQNDNANERSSGYLDKIEQEARTLSNLRHDRIPQFFGRFEENGYYYIVQEYIEGQDLSKEIIPGRQLSETQAIEMLREILKIVQFVHLNNIIHRDIKPANLIRRNSDNKIVLIDFGAVKEIRTVNTNNPGVTLTRGIGTDGYMPGEQAIGNPLKDPSFSFIGATGEVKFNTPTNGDRVNFSPTLVHLVPCQNGDRSHKFVPIDFPEDSICN